MPGPTIICDGVWKKFRRGERHDSLRDLIPAVVGGIYSREPDKLMQDEFWALQEVSFAVKPGEALGIIGPNGAGKSTMLKLMTKILKPTRGHCEVRGRIGALIEIGAGFHPDLTGRENIFLQGSIMGMKRSEIVRKLDLIVEFAGVRDFIDTPVKRYSSGMYARLGFSIAAHLDPDVLIIDEVLSVGDMEFQRRCIERMQEFKHQGVSIVFVSHDLQAVASLCTSGLYIQGEVRKLGPMHEAIKAYVGDVHQGLTPTNDSSVEIVSTQLFDDQGCDVLAVKPGAQLTLRVTYQARENLTDLTLGFVLHRSNDGLLVYAGNVQGREVGLDAFFTGERITIDFGFRAHVIRGQYHLECHVFHNPTHRFLSRLRPAGIFAVEETRSYQGVADLELEAAVVVRV